MHPIVIGNHTISPNHPPFIIAEMSGNHNGSLEYALKIVEAVAKSGAQAIKLQTYTADTMTINLQEGEFTIQDKNSLWHGRSLYDLYEEAHTPWEWHKPIFEYAKSLGLIAFSSAFDETAVDFLTELDVPCFKIASFENTDIPLLRKIASTGKPIIMSTGMATKEEIQTSLETLYTSGAKEIILLKCTSSYPASPKDSNLATMADMQRIFNVPIGLSDHTLGIGAAVASVALGGCVIEKHVTLNREDGGVDAAFSLEPAELSNLVIETTRAWQSVGKIIYAPDNAERKSRIFRRSLYVTKDIYAGEIFTKEHIRNIRPGLGLPPAAIDKILGKKASQDIKRGTPMTHELYL